MVTSLLVTDGQRLFDCLAEGEGMLAASTGEVQHYFHANSLHSSPVLDEMTLRHH